MTAKVGIKEVARLAGVSPGTVSKVLKNYPGISDETRRKVLTVVEETGFIPNTVASALSAKKNDRIALYIYVNDRNQQIDEINMQYILGAFDEARKHGLKPLTVFDASIEDYSNEETVRAFHSMHVETIIVFGINKDDEKIHFLASEGRMNMVVIDGHLEGEHVSTVMIDNAKAQYETADQVCEKGDKVLYLRGKDNGYVTDMRLEGMQKLAKDKDLDLHIENGNFSEDQAYQIVKDLDETYDAIICANDMMAIGARRALPEGSPVKLTGFDGIRLMEYVADDVVTCKQDFYKIGCEAVKAAVKLSQGEKGEQIFVPYEITRIHR